MAKVKKQQSESATTDAKKSVMDNNRSKKLIKRKKTAADNNPFKLNVTTKTIKKEKKKGLKRIARHADPTELINELLKDNTEKKAEDALQGYKIIKWKINDKTETVHHLFVKKHEVAIAELSRGKPPGRTIMCHNIPPYLNERHVQQIFKTFGTVERVYVHQKPTSAMPQKFDSLFPSEKDVIRGFKVAYIVYSDNKLVKELMQMKPEEVEPVVLKGNPAAGVPRWINQYNSTIVPVGALERSVRMFMDNFDKEEVRRKEMEKNANEPDDDGWVTVTRTGKRSSGGLVRSEAMEQRLREKKRRQDKQLMNFTPAQVKETKMKQLLELKKKFEEDKQRVALVKQQRKFKPF